MKIISDDHTLLIGLTIVNIFINFHRSLIVTTATSLYATTASWGTHRSWDRNRGNLIHRQPVSSRKSKPYRKSKHSEEPLQCETPLVTKNHEAPTPSQNPIQETPIYGKVSYLFIISGFF